jgi:hypothetical protein
LWRLSQQGRPIAHNLPRAAEQVSHAQRPMPGVSRAS